MLIVNTYEWGPERPDDGFPRDIGQWIANAYDRAAPNLAFWRAQREAPPERTDYDAIVISGSASSVYDKEPWIEGLAEQTRRWADADVPILGICFGHQVVAHALGGRVEKNPKGWEVGTHQVSLTPEGERDPLFEGLSSPLTVMESHQDIVVEPPPGSVCLAGNEKSEFQALAIGDRIRTVQFHPEYTAEQIRYLIAPRRERLTKAGVDFDKEFDSIRETPESRSLLDRFAEAFARDRTRTGLPSGTRTPSGARRNS